MNKQAFCSQISELIIQDEPFLFMVDFEKRYPMVVPLSQCRDKGIHYHIGNLTNFTRNNQSSHIKVTPTPVSIEQYRQGFSIVHNGILKGNSFLTNLTFPTPIACNSSLEQINRQSIAPYKLMMKDQFVIFSPEAFIRIQNNKIETHPMKGTILASEDNAKQKLLSNKKEQWEHNTIVDLMRNDLSMVAQDVEVKDFRYISEIHTQRGKLLQTSTHIEGQLNPDWTKHFGELLLKMLPAGSICGAPKDKTLKIIKEAEIDSRGYYTGIFGIYNKGCVDSAVAIRYIEQLTDGTLQYRSGGGITFMSDAEEEYDELIKKIYVPCKE